MSDDVDQIWRLENQIYSSNKPEVLKTIQQISELITVPDTNKSQLLLVLSKYFIKSDNLIFKTTVLDVLQNTYSFYSQLIQDWKPILDLFLHDTYSSFY